MEEYERILNWIPEEFEIYHYVLSMLEGSEVEKETLEQWLRGIDPTLGQRVLQFGLDKWIIREYGTKYKISISYVRDETPYLIAEAEED